jgi:glycosyltransferase involved in cell wall biosynthesis
MAETPLPLTVVIPALNEAQRIGAALDKLRWADEVIVVDGGSEDDTAAIARSRGAEVLVRTGLTIGARRNVAIDVARNDWILALDADETATTGLVEEIRAMLAAPAYDAYSIPFRNFYAGREITRGEWARESHVRLFRRRRYDSALAAGGRRFLETKVHERLEDGGPVGTLRERIEHHPYRDLEHHLRKMIKYARLGAEEARARGRTAGMSELALRPAWRFFRQYVLHGAFRDGRIGFVMAALTAMSVFLKYAFLYLDER